MNSTKSVQRSSRTCTLYEEKTFAMLLATIVTIISSAQCLFRQAVSSGRKNKKSIDTICGAGQNRKYLKTFVLSNGDITAIGKGF